MRWPALGVPTVFLAGAFLLATPPAWAKRRPPEHEAEQPAGHLVDPNLKSPFDTSAYRPLVVFHDFDIVTTADRITLTGVVFSRAPVDRVTLGKRAARLRPAEPAELIRFQSIPPGARDAPYRVFFEIPDVMLEHVGANDLDVRALSSDGRLSDLHRVTVIRTTRHGESVSPVKTEPGQAQPDKPGKKGQGSSLNRP